MKISYKQPQRTSDVSSANGTAFSEFWKLMLSAAVLLVAIYFLWGVIVDAVVAGISFETEARLFKSFKPKPAEITRKATLDRFNHARAILHKLQSGRQVPDLPYDLVLMEQTAPNAFAIPGGAIGVTSGLLEALSEDIEIAFVIGHELGHFKHRDHLEGLGRSAGFRLIMALLFDIGAGSETFSDVTGFVLERRYSQNRERDADRFALELVHEVYGSVDGTDRLFKLLLGKGSIPKWAYMFSTHPSPESRIADLQAFGAKLMNSTRQATP